MEVKGGLEGWRLKVVSRDGGYTGRREGACIESVLRVYRECIDKVS